MQFIYSRLAATELNWALTGSAGLAYQGLPVQPNDIDIQTDEAGAYAMERMFASYIAKPVAYSSNGRIRSHFGKLLVDGIEVEIMGDIEKLVDGQWEKTPPLASIKRIVQAGDMRLPVLSPDYEAEAYRKLGRFEKAEMIRLWQSS
ncbi:nucleotidyltransferase domain-containing protein [Paenibacillus konkukensis]|uniref:nucleotidyltransferase domain-containing protein n=1 Tax=Paenibacillus konkukensis TaxID=2020716 RepID=UPI00201DCF18|nr:hypothetical protein [Paenibacillus konkukensis]